jgi:vacuolar-type H+-ATPase subunit I/STV1
MSGDLSALIKDKSEVPNEVLLSTWQQIEIDYCDMSADETFKMFVNDKSNEAITELRISHIKSLCGLLKQRYEPIYIDVLHQYGYTYEYNIADIDSYLQDIERVLGSLIHDELRLQEIKGNIETYKEQHKGTGSKDGYFDKMLAQITSGLGLKFVPLKRETTVTQFCNFITLLKETNGSR